MTDIRGILVASQIVPAYGNGDGVIRDHPTHLAQFGKGGWREVSTIEERDAITDKRLEKGMAVYVNELSKLYILTNIDTTTDPYTRTWEEFRASSTDAVRKVSILPAAAMYDFEIVQYIGADTEDYINGYFYQCCVYEHESTISTTVNSETITEVTCDKNTFESFVSPTEDTTINFTYSDSELSWLVDGDTVDIANYGVQIVGEPSNDDTIELDYTAATRTQEWLRINVQPPVDVSGKVDKTDEANKIYGTDNAGEQTTYDLDDFGLVDDVLVNDESVVVDKIARINTQDRVRRVSQLPATPEIENEIVEYIGTTTSNYTQGYFYQSHIVVTPEEVDFETNVEDPAQVEFSEETFLENIQPELHGVWMFTYNVFAEEEQTGWYYNGQLVDPADYGITLTGEFEQDNTLRIEYTPESESNTWSQVNIQPTTEVIDNLNSESSTAALSANQGRILQSEIQILQGFGRFLGNWDCEEGLPEDETLSNPYEYQKGDYFLVSNIDDTTNYRPDSDEYTGEASETEETEEVSVNDFYFYNGTDWKLLYNTQKTVTFESIAGDPEDNEALAELLDDLTSDKIRKLSVLPVDESFVLDEIVQYIGTTTQDYVNGYFYKATNITVPSRAVATSVPESIIISEINTETFESQFDPALEDQDIITFTYDESQSSWVLNSEPIVIADYGIQYSGTPDDLDSLVITYNASETHHAWNRVNVQPLQDISGKQNKDYTEVYKVGFNGGWQDANLIIDEGSHISKVNNNDGSATISVSDITDDGDEIAADDTGLTTGKAVYEYVDEISGDKVDKTDTANQLYGTDDNGDQTTLTYSTTATDSHIVQRDENGQVIVPETPTEDEHAASKKYVDDGLETKVDKTNVASKVYGTDANGDQTTYDLDDFGDVDDVQLHGQSVVINKIAKLDTVRQVTVLPTEPLIGGEIVQYIGATNENYTNGYFYKQTDRNTTYSNAQFTPLGDYEIDVSISDADLTTFLNDVVTHSDYPFVSGRFGYYMSTPEVLWSFSLETDGHGFRSYSNTPEGYAELGFTVTPPIGPSQGLDFTVENTTTWVWERVNVQPETEVINNLTSTSTTSALSANMGRELQEEIEVLQGRGRFLSLWNCATGLPETNPQSSPYEYTSGDYYVVGNVASTHSSSATISQTAGSSLSNITVDLETFESEEEPTGNETVAFTASVSVDPADIDFTEENGWEITLDVDDIIQTIDNSGVTGDYIDGFASGTITTVDGVEFLANLTDTDSNSHSFDISSYVTITTAGTNGTVATISSITRETSTTTWEKDSDTVDLADYGISFEGTPVDDDELTVIYIAATYNYKPDGTEYIIGVASDTVESEIVNINDTYIYDGSVWKLQINSQREVSFSSIIGSPYDNTALSNALDSKVEDIQVNGTSIVVDNVANIELESDDVAYTNEQYSSMQTIQDALDHLLYITPSVSISGGNNFEIGSTVSEVILNWAWNKTIQSQSLNQGIGDLDPELETYTYDTPITSNTTFTISGTDGTNTASASTSVTFMPKRYWGVSANTSLTDADILTLSQELSTSRAQTRVFDCSGGNYFYFVIKTSYCNGIRFKVNGFEFSDMEVVTRNVENAQGYVDEYNIYRVHHIQTGSGIEVQVL